jgi:hypothetical protein
MSKYLFILSTLFCSIHISAQDNRVTQNEDLKGVFEDTWTPAIFRGQGDLGVDNGTTGGDSGQNVTDAPIDGGLGFLLAAGVGYYANGVRKRRRQKNQNDSEGKNGDK